MADIDLTTLADVKAYLGAATLPPAADAVLNKLITAISAFFASYCSRDFRKQDYTDKYDGTGTDTLMLRNTPVNSVSSVTLDTRAVPIASSPLVQGYDFDDKTLYYVNGCWHAARRNVVVAYNAGYTLPAGCPQDLAQACVEAVADRYRRRDNIGIQARSIANETITYSSKDLPASVKSVLNAYQRAAPL